MPCVKTELVTHTSPLLCKVKVQGLQLSTRSTGLAPCVGWQSYSQAGVEHRPELTLS